MVEVTQIPLSFKCKLWFVNDMGSKCCQCKLWKSTLLGNICYISFFSYLSTSIHVADIDSPNHVPSRDLLLWQQSSAELFDRSLRSSVLMVCIWMESSIVPSSICSNLFFLLFCLPRKSAIIDFGRFFSLLFENSYNFIGKTIEESTVLFYIFHLRAFSFHRKL